MTARVEYEISCDGAPGMGPFDCPRRIFAEASAVARREAKRAGWTTARRNRKLVDLCPDHQPPYREAA